MTTNPEKKVDFYTEWPKVVAGFNQILLAIETGRGITTKEWMLHYNSVFQLAVAQHEEKMYIEIAKLFENFVRGQSKKIFEKGTGELMLREYLKLFGDFMKTSLSVSRICRYLQRYWIPGNVGKSPSNIEVREIYPLALVMWRQFCFDPIKEKLIPALLDLLDQDRQGNKQDKSLIRNMVGSYIEFDKVGPNEGQQFYEKEFETPYLERVRQFYAKESSQFLTSNGVSLYLSKAEDRIREEKENSQNLGIYLVTSDPKIKKAIDEVLIEKHMEILQSDFLRMLVEDKEEDMRRLYFLLQRITDGLSHTANTFQAYLTETGSKIVIEQKKRPLKEALANAIMFVKQLMNFYTKYSNLVQTVCFSGHPLFRTALDKAFKDILNQESGKFNIPRLLNFYIDNMIKGKEKENSTEEEIDEILQKQVNLFTYLQDKDEFFEYFRKSLCKRLLSKGKQYNENAEKSFLSKIKAQSGDSAIRRLQGMFTDVTDETITEQKQKFEAFNKGSKVAGVELEVQVLNESHWPISGTQKFPLLLGQTLLACQTKFQQYYETNTERRRLQWLFNYGTVTLSGRFTNSKVPVSIVVTPLQASILMCFNIQNRLTFQELLLELWPQQSQSTSKVLTISQNSNLSDMSLEEILRFAIQPLVYFKYKVLGKEKDDDPKKRNY